MRNTIKCKKCGTELEISEAFKQQLEKQIVASIEERHKKEIDQVKLNIEKKAREKYDKEFELKNKNKEAETIELQKRNKELTDQLIQLNKILRALKEKDENRELRYQKQLNQDRDQIKERIIKNESEKSHLEIAELKKKLIDTEKALIVAQQKTKQGSQQLQGEVLELDLEETLKKAFPRDKIEDIKTGVSGADIRQTVLSPRGFKCGVILWESKRRKRWSDTWIRKLKSDLRSEGADVPVIVSEVLPDDAKSGIGEKDGVSICNRQFIVALAQLLRVRLLEVAYQKAVSSNRTKKSEMIYSFVTSREFGQQIEAILEIYKEGRGQIEQERRAFEKQWKQREMQLKRLMLSVANIYGNMQGIAGSAMPQIKDLEMTQIESGKKKT